LLERKVVLGDVAVESVRSEAIFQADAPVLHVRCGSQDATGPALHALLPLPDALALGALRAGEEPGPAREQPFEGARAEGFGEVAKLIVAVLSRLLEEEHGSAPIALQEALPVLKPSSEPTWLTAGAWWRLQMGLAVKDLPEGQLTLLLPCGSSEAGDAADVEEEGDDGLPLLVLEPSEELRSALEEMSEPLGREITALAPGELNLQEPEEIQEAHAVVVSWDLAGRSGLELVEHLARDERTARVPILMAAENPTRAMVRASLRAGACSFVCKPYEVEELRARVRAARKAARLAEAAAEVA